MKGYAAIKFLGRFPKRNERVIAWRKIEKEVVVVNLENNTFNILNPVATRIWQLADGKISLGEIVERLHREFEVRQDVLVKDCLKFLQEMVEKNLIIYPLPSQTRKGKRRRIIQADGNILFEALREKMMKKKIPLVVHFDLTYRCNLACVHCYVTRQERPELSTLEIKRIIKQLAEAGTLHLTLSGGEILGRKDFFEIALYARKLNFALRLLTNGVLINEETADKIAALYPDLVAISIYSTKPEIHDRVTRRSGSLQKSLLAARLLKERKVRLKISTVIMKQNIEEWHRVYELAQDLEAQFQADYRITPRSDGGRYPLRFHIGKEDLPNLLSDTIFTRRKENKAESEKVYNGVFNDIPCGAGHMSCYISPYGDIYPCVQLPINCGDLRRKSFADIWENSPQLHDIRSITLSQLPVCSNCTFFRHCRVCIGLNYMEEGDIFFPSKRACEEAEIMKKLGLERR